jgi:pimeloyl-ACP methyl ester carboxylesterase
MTTYALIHGAYDVGWYWHLVERELQERGPRSVAPDLPIEDDDASLKDHAQSVVDAIDKVHDGGELIVVGQSWGGYIAPIVAHLAKADRLVLVAPMVPMPGETDEEMWKATGFTFPQGEADAFYHDVDPALAAEAKSRERGQSETTSREPWPLDAWPSVPTHVIIGKNDRFFPADWLRGVVRERLGIEPDEIACGHTVALSRPRELVDLMESYRTTSARPTG